MSLQLPLLIRLEKPPAGLDFGLQKGAAGNHQMVQVQRSDTQNLHFNVLVEIKGDRQKMNQPDFGGPFVQGKPADRFIYINCGMSSEPEPWWRSRLKIPLTGITWNTLDQLHPGSEQILATSVPGTGKNGGPNCATVKPFDGWKITRLSK